MKLVSIPANPVPDNFVTDYLKTPDGLAIRYARWQPPAGRRGTVCIFQGRGEWIEKYFETVRDLRARGFAVATLDWRGQGLSERMLSDRHKGYVRRFADYDADLETFMREIVLPDCPPPLFALGHSTGATVLIRAAHRGHRWFDRMVLIAPLIGLAGAGATPTASTIVRVLRLGGFGSMYVLGAAAAATETRPFATNIVTFGSQKCVKCAQCRGSGGGADARHRPPHGCLGRCSVSCHAYDVASALIRRASASRHPHRIRRPRCRCVECGDRRICHLFGAPLARILKWSVPNTNC